jgi:hypothetical protein
MKTNEQLAERLTQAEAERDRLLAFISAQYGWQCFPTKEATTSALDVAARYKEIEPLVLEYREKHHAN